MKGINLFLAYAPEDAEYREQIGNHLTVLKDRGFLNEYCISEVLAGCDSDLSILKMMNEAKIILLLISSDFLASDECRKLEDLAFSMKMRNDAIVIPVLLRPCMYDESYNDLQILPDNKKAISDRKAWHDVDEALANVAERIKQLVVKIQSGDDDLTLAASSTQTSTSQDQSSSPTSVPFINRKIMLGFLGIGLFALAAFFFWPTSNNRTSASPTVERKVTKKENDIKKIAATPVKKAVPNLTKSNWRNVKQKLVKAGFTNFREEKIVSCDVKAGTVMNQKPSAGSKIQMDDIITVAIAETPKRIKAAPISGGNKLVTIRSGRKYSQNAWAIRNTNVEFSLEGTKCSKGDITVEHPLGGTQKHSIKAGQKKNNTRFFGAGRIDVYFSSNDPSAVLKVRIW